MIISASRRCDILRFKLGWFLERLDAGFVDVANPFNAAQVKRVSLLDDDVDFMIFWTRDPRPLLSNPVLAEKYPFYVMVTLTAYPNILEPDMPPRKDVIETMNELAGKWKERVIWRYDPVLLTNITNFDFHKKNFANLASRLSGNIERVIISVYDEYSGAKRRFDLLEEEGTCRILPHYSDDSHLLPEVKQLLGELMLIAKDAGMEMQSCAETELSDLGIKLGACIDGQLIRKITGKSLPGLDNADKNQRPGCRCVPSVDIGTYGSCPARCVYCYARR